MSRMRMACAGAWLTLAAITGQSTMAWAQGRATSDDVPAIFRNDVGPMGRSRQTFDRENYERYRGDPGAQMILKQQRQYFCRNYPQMC